MMDADTMNDYFYQSSARSYRVDDNNDADDADNMGAAPLAAATVALPPLP